MKTYAFDPSLDAKSLIKERLVWMIYMGIFFFLFYGAANQLASLNGPHPSVYMEWERQIPFIPTFIVPYMSSDLIFIIAFLLPYTRLELRVLVARILFIVLFSVAFFILMPLEFVFEKPLAENFEFLFKILQADQPYNQLPSLHISFAIVLWASMRKYIYNSLVRYFILLWFWLIVFSTLFVYQHHFIDIPTGALVGIISLYVIKEDKENTFLNRFTTPRSLKMGLYYLVVAIFAMLGAFQFNELWVLFLWLFIATCGVSIAYAFGLNTLLAGKSAKANLWQWALFLPYFLGNYLSWYYYKKKLPLITQVEENVYFGRMPTYIEYNELQKYNIHTILNLATEHQLNKSSIDEYRLPFLDQTIHAPEILHDGVLFIESNKESGIFIHCALGLSRSVLLVSAWLMYKGVSLQDVQNRLQYICPKCVKSSYMTITLEIYANYIDTILERNHETINSN